MKTIAIAVFSGSLWLAVTAFGQAPASGPANRVQVTSCPCDQNGGGKCGMRGRGAGQGGMQGRGGGRGRGMAMRGMGRGNGACMRMMQQAPPTQAESPKTEKK